MKISTSPISAFRIVSSCIALAFAVMLSVSCSQKIKEESPAVATGNETEVVAIEPVEEEVVAPVEVRVGRIMGVGESGRFVVIALDQGATVETGDTLKARFSGSQTAVLKVSPERQGNLVTADVVAGTPAKDHEVVK